MEGAWYLSSRCRGTTLNPNFLYKIEVGGRKTKQQNQKTKIELDAGWPESEEEQVGNVKLEEEVTRRIRIDRQEERQTYLDR